MIKRKHKKVLALDLSTNTGYAVLDNTGTAYSVLKSGTIEAPVTNGPYPYNYISRANNLARDIEQLLLTEEPDVVVIEETNGSKSRYTQKLLEFIHYAVVDTIWNSNIDIAYINTSDWRKTLNVALSAEDKKNNAKLSKAKSAAKKSGKKLDKKALGIKGRVTKKHAAVRVANAKFGLSLKMKDNDIADAICLGSAFIDGVSLCDGK